MSKPVTRQFSHQYRSELLAELRDKPFDLLIVGGGITGAGIAFDASLRGLRVALVEKEDFGAGTSSKSSKLVHGGLRYLEQLEFALVMEGTAERALLRKGASHTVRPLPFIYPIYRSHKHAPWFIQLGMWLYDILALFRNYRRHKRLSANTVNQLEPALKNTDLRAAMKYYDCITDDARLTLENIQGAFHQGATIVSGVEMVGFTPGEPGAPSSVQLRDTWSGEELTAQTGLVVNAAGPWTNQVLELENCDIRRMVRPTKGVHLVVPRAKLPIEHAIVLHSPEDGRVTFAIPWEESVAFGTTDTDYDGPLDDVQTSPADVDYLLQTMNQFFPDAHVGKDDILSTWAGLRPLIADDSDNPYNTSREHEVVVHSNRVITIAGGKLTTYRKMAQECVDTCLKHLGALTVGKPKPCVTKEVRLPAAQHFTYATQREQAVQAAVERQVPHAAAERLVQRYGGKWQDVLAFAHPDVAPALLDPAGLVLEAEVAYGIACEMVGSLEDFLVRRTHLFYHLPDQGLAAAEKALEILAKELNWDEKRTIVERTRYQTLVEANRSWKN